MNVELEKVDALKVKLSGNPAGIGMYRLTA
jgi:hypothetical protein